MFFIVVLGAFAAVFEHGAHRGIAVDVRVVALHVGIVGRGERQFVENLHQAGLHLAGAGAFGAVENVAFGDFLKAVAHQRDFHRVLNILHLRRFAGAFFFDDGAGGGGDDGCFPGFGGVAGGIHRFLDGAHDFAVVV